MINTNIPLSKINKISSGTILEVLDIQFTGLGEDYIVGTMPVDKRTIQPAGLLHGGATAVLIETLGSMGSQMIAEGENCNAVGLDINANHIRGVREGLVTGKAKIVHCGRKTHVWQVDVTNEDQKLVCTGRLTVMITPKK
jgi:1,4-dihydroxy-2-naphthoyl-CoA hydrolase